MIRRITHGIGNAIEIDLPEGTTFDQLIRNPRVKAALAYGDLVDPAVLNEIQDRHAVIPPCREVQLISKPEPKQN